MKNLTFRMYAAVEFNRNIEREKDYLSPGGYEMKMGNKKISFDFTEYESSVDSRNPKILHIECRNPDYDEFEDLEKLKIEDLERVLEISEFFVFTGEKGETDLKPVRLLSCAFCLPYENWRIIGVPTSVCKKASLACCI